MTPGGGKGPPNSNAHEGKLRVLGMDPSFRNWGYAYAYVDPQSFAIEIDKIQLVVTQKSTDKRVRATSDALETARMLHQALHDAIEDWNPVAVITEIPSGSQDARAARGLGIAVGVMASLGDLPLVQVTPQQVKKVFTGNKIASKDAMIAHAMELYPELDWKLHQGKPTKAMEHPADAVAAVHAGVENEVFRELVKIYQMFHKIEPLARMSPR